MLIASGHPMETTESTRSPKRVVVSVPRKSPYWSKAWESSEEVIAVALRLIGEGDLVSPDAYDDPSRCLFVAKERWDERTYIVFDIFHDSYNYDEAHLPGRNDLPVVLVLLKQRGRVYNAPPPMMNRANTRLRELYDSTGWGSHPPFSVDHADGRYPTYWRPRSCIIVRSGGEPTS